MKISSKYITFFTAIVLFTSCEKEIDIAIADRERKIVINSTFKAGQPLQVNLTKSLSIIDRANIIYLPDATVSLFENNTFIEQLTYSNFNHNYHGTLPLTESNLYSVEVLWQGKTATASDTIPQSVEIIQIDTSTFNYYDYKYLSCKMKFVDPVGSENYYMFTSNVLFESNDIVIDRWIYIDNDTYMLFTDNMIQGKEYEMNLLLDNSWNEPTIYFYFYSISKSYYNYLKTLSAHLDAKNDPFAEPVQVFTNVENGVGIFAGYSIAMDSIVFDSIF